MNQQRATFNEDRISEVYKGGLWSERLTKIAQNRIDWICSEVVGETVLDIGCSQGIASILLARSGRKVVGIDIDPGAISYAQKDALKEDKQVQNRLRFELVSIEEYKSRQKFDSIILGEVVEHQTAPLEFVAKAVQFLGEGGRLILTTPFGHDPHHDHYTHFFPSWFSKLASLGLNIDHLDVSQGYIYVTATLSDDSAVKPTLTRILKLTERGALNSQKLLYRFVEERDHAIVDRDTKLEKLQKLVERAKSSAREKSALVEKFRDTISRRDNTIANLKKEISSERENSKKEISKLQNLVNRTKIAAREKSTLVEKLRITISRRDNTIEKFKKEISSLKKVVIDKDHAIKTKEFEIKRNRGIEIKNLGLIDRVLEENRKLQNDISTMKRSRRFQFANLIAESLRQPNLLARLPLRLIKIARSSRKAQQSAHMTTERVASGDDAQIISVRQATVWKTYQVSPLTRYRVKGRISSGRSYMEKGALILMKFRSKGGSQLVWSRYPFVQQKDKDRSAAYLSTGHDVEFCFEFEAPVNARYADIGVERFQEKPPVILTIERVSVANANDRRVPPIGLRSLGSGEARVAQPSAKTVDPTKPLIGAILDEFTRDCLKPEANLVLVTKKRWRDELPRAGMAAFFAESAWRGNEGSWNYAMTKPDKWGSELAQLLSWCRESGIPTIFWNKEDPVNFDVFKETATRFDYIFTTDSACVQRYRDIVGHDRVHTLAFAAQPAIHNPIRTGPLVNRFAFTGSWRGVKYPKRAEWLDTLLTPLMDRQLLDIFDRYADEKTNPDLIFPDRFRPALRGALPYAELVEKVYKQYFGFVSVNSVEGSETMLARRVFEILACGSPVISSPSEAIERTFGDIVLTPTTPKDVEESVERLVHEPFFRERLAARGVRLVHSNHTYRHRMIEIGDRIGRPFVSRDIKKVSIICCSKRPRYLEQIAAQICAQSYREKEVIFVAHSNEFRDEDIERAFGNKTDLKIMRNHDQDLLSHGLNIGVRESSGELIAKFDDDDFYGINYLEDTVLAFDYAQNASVIGKHSFFAYVESADQTYLRFPGKSNCYTNRVHGGTLVWSQKNADGINFRPVRQGTDSRFLEDCRNNGLKIYSTNPFNFIHVRYADIANHTWKIEDEEFIQKAESVGQGKQLSTVMV